MSQIDSPGSVACEEDCAQDCHCAYLMETSQLNWHIVPNNVHAKEQLAPECSHQENERKSRGSRDLGQSEAVEACDCCPESHDCREGAMIHLAYQFVFEEVLPQWHFVC